MRVALAYLWRPDLARGAKPCSAVVVHVPELVTLDGRSGAQQFIFDVCCVILPPLQRSICTEIVLNIYSKDLNLLMFSQHVPHISTIHRIAIKPYVSRGLYSYPNK